MMHRFLAFDIEIANAFPSGQTDWRDYRPLGITCAATYDGEGQPRLWYSRTAGGEAASRMTLEDMALLLAYLQQAAEAGYTLLSWNGVGFDFEVLGDESNSMDTCARLAVDHVDMMFHIFCLRGHTLGLDKVAKGMGLPGKPPGMSGEMAPRYWAEGKWAVVLDYVAQDARTTFQVAQIVEDQGELRWVSERNTRQHILLPDGWLTVRQALKLPQPDTSWMQRQVARNHFTGWISQVDPTLLA